MDKLGMGISYHIPCNILKHTILLHSCVKELHAAAHIIATKTCLSILRFTTATYPLLLPASTRVVSLMEKSPLLIELVPSF